MTQSRNLEVGDVMPDGTVYAGISTQNNRPMFVTSQDMSVDDPELGSTFNAAAARVSVLDVHGHKDWKIVSGDDMAVIEENKHKGALKGTFNETSGNPGYWTDEKCDVKGNTYTLSFFNGNWSVKEKAKDEAFVRPVRYG